MTVFGKRAVTYSTCFRCSDKVDLAAVYSLKQIGGVNCKVYCSALMSSAA